MTEKIRTYSQGKADARYVGQSLKQHTTQWKHNHVIHDPEDDVGDGVGDVGGVELGGGVLDGAVMAGPRLG
ncbi:unnamed protein product [Lactuca virosa]|uniref:Uncharacterized protein n=1 Tax=Lactuca virosa TaxID=75947 RepID=A0AAU9NSZ9_9ASTR|nr:unnamed protein product [Lactuca virosa]